MKRIVLIDLGGTISSQGQNRTSEFYNQKGNSINNFIKEFNFKEPIEIQYEGCLSKISHEITVDELMLIAIKIQELVNQEEVSGIVVSMGTNSMEDVAYFIGLVVKTNKNITFTGAQYPQNHIGFDGLKNLYNALIVSSTSTHVGVTVTFNDVVVAAKWAIKSSPGISNNFTFENIGIIGYVVGEKFQIKMLPIYKQTFKSIFSISDLTTMPKILVIYAHLCIDNYCFQDMINNDKIQGIVSAGYGKGYQTTVLSTILSNAVNKNIPVVRCSRTGHSITNIDENYDEKYGFIVSSDLTCQKASILLALCIAKSLHKLDIQEIFMEY